ncbi:hypothetical protein BDF14DRAFT_1885832 [Spinellus fusiger]|nr:hypothetical protein BDF14DRAFT_1885832 [Spinellus fusiger]
MDFPIAFAESVMDSHVFYDAVPLDTAEFPPLNADTRTGWDVVHKKEAQEPTRSFQHVSTSVKDEGSVWEKIDYCTQHSRLLYAQVADKAAPLPPPEKRRSPSFIPSPYKNTRALKLYDYTVQEEEEDLGFALWHNYKSSGGSTHGGNVGLRVIAAKERRAIRRYRDFYIGVYCSELAHRLNLDPKQPLPLADIASLDSKSTKKLRVDLVRGISAFHGFMATQKKRPSRIHRLLPFGDVVVKSNHVTKQQKRLFCELL